MSYNFCKILNFDYNIYIRFMSYIIFMREIPLILYYLMVCVVWLYALIFCISHFEKEKNKIYSEKDKELKDMPWRVFEKEIAECFSQRWWKSILGKWSADDWIDIEIKKDWKIYLIQCKHRFWDLVVRSQQIREFDWAIHQYNTRHHTKAKWIFITTWTTTSPARETADSLWIHLWDRVNKWEYNVNHFVW